MSKLILIAVVLLSGCGSSDTAKMDAGNTADAPASGTPLTVKNFLSWCSVKVGTGAASSGASQVVNVTPGAIAVTATAVSATFKIAPNMWHHTDGDTGAGDTGTVTGATSAATITVAASAKCAWVCCPFQDGTGCPATDQCP